MKLQEAQDYYCNWHDWFAWRPVRINENEVAWLETVERKADWVARYTHWFFVYEPVDCQYRAKVKWKDKLL